MKRPEELEKRSKNVREKTRNISDQTARRRLLSWIRRQGLSPKKGAKDEFGRGREGRGLTYTDEAGASPEHEMGHLLQTPAGRTLADEQYRLSIPQDPGGRPRMSQEAAGSHESTASSMEAPIRRRAGIGFGRDGADFRDGAPSAGPQEAANRAAAQAHLGQYESGIKQIGTANPGTMSEGVGMVPGTSVDAKINARAGVTVKTPQQLRIEATRNAIRKAEELTKTSKNAKFRRLYQDPGPQLAFQGMEPDPQKLTVAQVLARRTRYAQSLGLRPEPARTEGFPRAQGNRLPYNRLFGVEHETAHAMMTPDGKTVNQYQKWLTDHSKDDKRLWDVGEPDLEHEQSVSDENVASAIEPHIDRRSGVDPHEFSSGFREGVSEPYSGFVDGFYDWSGDRATVQHGVYPSAFREQSRHHIDRFDRGARFKRGRIVEPNDLDAKINTAGTQTPADRLEALRARARASRTTAPQTSMDRALARRKNK